MLNDFGHATSPATRQLCIADCVCFARLAWLARPNSPTYFMKNHQRLGEPPDSKWWAEQRKHNKRLKELYSAAENLNDSEMEECLANIFDNDSN